MLHKLSYSAYCSPSKVADITRDPEMARPILFYEKIAKLSHLRPYLLAIILSTWGFTFWAVQPWENPEVFEITISTLTLERMILSSVGWTLVSLIFFYSLSYIKDAYFQTIQTLRPLISGAKYKELKENLCRKNLTYISLSVMSCGLIFVWCYEFYLGYKLGFWSENLPIWSALRYGPISFLFATAPCIPWIFFYSDLINETFSWFYLPFAIKSSVKETARKDPEIFGDVKAFDKLSRSILRVALLLVTISVLVVFLMFITPMSPFLRMGYAILIFIFIPYLFAARLKNSAIKKSITELQDELKRREKKGDSLGSAQTAEKLADFQKKNGQMDKSYQSILQAAKNYENAGEYEDAAQNYSLAGKHREAAAAYKKQCQKEENEDFARYYEACYYSELSERLMTERKMEEAYENISLASNIFGQVERVAKNDYLKHSSLYRRWESEGRLHVMKALKECDLLHGIRIYRANIDSIVREFDRAIRAFERAEKKCKGLGSDPLLQLNIHITWCETYKRLLIFKNIEKWEIRKMPTPTPTPTLKELTIQLITFLKLTFTFKPGTVEKRAKTSLLDASVAYLSNMQTELVKSNRVKVKRQVDMALYTLRALKEFKFSNDEIKASDHVKKAIEIARELRIWKTTDVGDELNDQINRLFEIIFHFNFQFSAPKCPVVNINAYKDYVQFTYDGLDKIDSQNYLRFKIYYDPPHEEAAFEDTITTVLVVRCDEEKDERRLHIEARKEEIESFPVEFPKHEKKKLNRSPSNSPVI
jgi:tetratricopeptide (TPR) repeat protein